MEYTAYLMDEYFRFTRVGTVNAATLQEAKRFFANPTGNHPPHVAGTVSPAYPALIRSNKLRITDEAGYIVGIVGPTNASHKRKKAAG